MRGCRPSRRSRPGSRETAPEASSVPEIDTSAGAFLHSVGLPARGAEKVEDVSASPTLAAKPPVFSATAEPRIGVLTFPGSLDDRDLARGLRACGARVEMVWHKDRRLPELDGIAIPGGFSYGDYLRYGRDGALLADHGRRSSTSPRAAGRCSASATASRSCARRASCPGALVRNRELKFVCEDVRVAVEDPGNFRNELPPGRALRHAGEARRGRLRARPEPQAAGRVPLRRRQPERLDRRHRGHRERGGQRGRADAAPRVRRRSAARLADGGALLRSFGAACVAARARR